MPWLAAAVLDFNKTLSDASTEAIKLEGIMVGNGCTDYRWDTFPAAFETANNLNVMPEDIYSDYKKLKCDKKLT